MKSCSLVTVSIEIDWTGIVHLKNSVYDIPNEVFTKRKIGELGKVFFQWEIHMNCFSSHEKLIFFSFSYRVTTIGYILYNYFKYVIYIFLQMYL